MLDAIERKAMASSVRLDRITDTADEQTDVSTIARLWTNPNPKVR